MATRVLALVVLACLFGPGRPAVHAAEAPADGPTPAAGEPASRRAEPDARIVELDAFWAEVDRAVREGDFEAYAACCHPEGVLVSEPKNLVQPLSAALARWRPEFAATQAGRMTAEVQTRFTRRLGDATTAHESGMFRYTSRMDGEEPRTDFVPFEAILVKRDGRWLILVEHQKAHATQAEWERLAP